MADDKRLTKAQKLASQYHAVFGSPGGRAVLHDLMRVNFVLSSTVQPQNLDLSLVHEGQRNAILRIMTILKIDASKLLETIEEETSHV